MTNRGTRIAVSLFFALATTRAHAGDSPDDIADLRAAEHAAAGVEVLTNPTAPRATTAPPPIAPQEDLSRFSGRPVMRVAALVDDSVWTDVSPPNLTSVRVGTPFSPSLARRALSEALATDMFAGGRVDVAPDGAGVAIFVHLAARKIIDALRIELHGAAVERDDVLRELDMTEGGEIVDATLAEARARIKALFARRGYPDAQPQITMRPTDDAMKIIVIVDIDPGPPRRVQRRIFYLSDPTSQDLASLAHEYGVRLHARVDEGAIEAADVKLAELLRAHGYFYAEVSHDLVRASGVVTLRVRVNAQSRYVARFDGNDHFDADVLETALGVAQDTDRSFGHLQQKLREFYIRRGFLDVEVNTESRGAPGAPLRYLVFHIVEHERARVVVREYPCFRPEQTARLTHGGPRTARAIGSEIDSFLEEELPGADLISAPSSRLIDETVGGAPPEMSTGARPAPIEFDPDSTFAPDVYERALSHVQELYRNEGFLSAQVGPVEIVRRRCDPRSPAGQCVPMPLPHLEDVCTYDASNLPLPVAPLDPAYTCVADPAHGVECEPRLRLRIPVKLGPRTTLYDLAFRGVKSFSEAKLAEIADVKLGEAVNTLKLEEARRRIVEFYKEDGFAYAEVKYDVDPSFDHTHARVRFGVTEGDRVIVRGFVVTGNTMTDEATIRRRIALRIGEPYRTSDVRKTEERIATLGVFSSVSVGLSDAYVPQASKVVVITVAERLPQHVELLPAFSTGEGFKLQLEYGHNNLAGHAIGFTFRVLLAYLPTPLIFDPTVRANFDSLGNPGLDKRTVARITATTTFPDIGLGPLVRGTLDAVAVHDLQTDFFITKIAGIPSITYRPIRQLQFTVAQSVELNYLHIFNYESVDAYEESQAAMNEPVNDDLKQELLLPNGLSAVSSQRFVVTWDRRDNAFNASRGTYLVSGIEHVDWYPIDQASASTEVQPGHFLRFTETFAGYLPLPAGMRFAAELRVGLNVQLTPTSTTYPDRFFFMGGVDSMRGWQLASMVPQDDIDKNTVTTDPIKGGNLMINPRFELRIPVKPPLETVIFADTGNLWRDASYPFDVGRFPIRASIGSGIRVQTPVGPLALDYGINVTRHPAYEDFGALNFAIGLF